MIIEKQSIPIANIVNIDVKNNYTNNNISDSKLNLTQFSVDPSTSKVNSTKLGSKSIIVRQDLVSDLVSIKSTLNSYGIPLSCNFINVSLDNTNISDVARLGLEINLNYESGMTRKSDLYNDDYYIGPDYNKPYGNWYRLKVYAATNKKNYDKNVKYQPIDYPVDVYDIRETYRIGSPKLKKIFMPMLDLTKMFEDHYFIQQKPNKDFFYMSDNLNSNWFVFYKTSKIKIGDTYVECLSKIYNNNGEPIWNNKEMKWDGEKFI